MNEGGNWQSADFYKEIFEEGIYHFETKSQEPIIIDAGANIGLSTLYFSKQYTSIISPTKTNFLVLIFLRNLENFLTLHRVVPK